MAEWSIAPVLKTGVRASGPWVRIPPPPLSRHDSRVTENASEIGASGSPGSSSTSTCLRAGRRPARAPDRRRAGDAAASGSRSGCSSRCGGRGSASRSSTTGTGRTSRASGCCSWPGASRRASRRSRSSRRRPATARSSRSASRPCGSCSPRARGQRRRREALRQRIAARYLASAVLFAVSIAVPEPWRYVLWAIAIGSESGALLNEDREAAHGRAASTTCGAAADRPGRGARRRTTSPSASGCS